MSGCKMTNGLFLFSQFLCVSLVLCNFSEHRHLSDNSTVANTVADGGGPASKAILFGFGSFVVILIMVHCFLKKKHLEKLSKMDEKYKFSFEWEEANV